MGDVDRIAKAVRLNRMSDLLKQRAFTPQELARSMGVSVRSIQRDLIAIQDELGEPLDHQDGRYQIRASDRLPRIDLNLHQARAMMVAVRLFMRYSDEGDPHAGAAMMALARIMPVDVRPQVTAAAEAIARRPVDMRFSRNLTDITEAWARRRVVQISYRSAGKRNLKEIVLHPYFIEPGAAGMATYVIGYSETHNSMRTFKVERIVSVTKLPRQFTIPDDTSIDEILSSAWGIIWGEGIDVVLRFRPEVTWRVRETTWHPSQSIEDLADGGCILRFSVASMMEVGRWVRSWGDTVEVLEPADLRAELRAEAVRLARVYSKPVKRPKKAAVRKRKPRAISPQQAPLPDTA